jgi:hypothetical protein
MFYLIKFFFHFLHISVILASVTLCFFKNLVYAHLILQAAILISWFVIGPLINKPGMCLITEIQRKIYYKYHVEFPSSYMVYLYNKFGIKVENKKKADQITFSVFTICTLISVIQIIWF